MDSHGFLCGVNVKYSNGFDDDNSQKDVWSVVTWTFLGICQSFSHLLVFVVFKDKIGLSHALIIYLQPLWLVDLQHSLFFQ